MFNILLQILDDGIVTDSQGRKISFKNTIIIMTRCRPCAQRQGWLDNDAMMYLHFTCVVRLSTLSSDCGRQSSECEVLMFSLLSSQQHGVASHSGDGRQGAGARQGRGHGLGVHMLSSYMHSSWV